VRAFVDDDVAHVEGQVSPKDDIETINTELVLADLQTIDRVLPRLEKEARTSKDRERRATVDAVHEAREVLDGGRTVFAAGLDTAPLRDLFLLTAKPFLYVFNVDEAGLVDEARRAELASLVAPAEAIFLDAKLEAELGELDEAEALELLRSVGQDEPGLGVLAHAGFRARGRSGGEPPHPRPRGRSTRTSSVASSRPRSCRTTTSSPRDPWPRPRRREEFVSRAKSTSWTKGTSSSSASTSEARLRRPGR
jgi:hypothetical protein